MKQGYLHEMKSPKITQELQIAMGGWRQNHDNVIMPNLVIVNQNDDQDKLLQAPPNMTIIRNQKAREGYIRLVFNPKPKRRRA